MTYRNAQCCANQNAHIYIKEYLSSLLKIMKIPTQKREHSCKYTELSLKRKEGIPVVTLKRVY